MDSNKIKIIETDFSNLNDIIIVETEAFGYKAVAKLTAELLTDETALPMVSLLAFYEGEAIGHILFTKACLQGQEEALIHILAPLAIMPKYQNQGVGGLLIKEGISRLQTMGSNLVFVLGHKGYYPKYGFIPNAAKLGYLAPYPIAEEFVDCWMVQAISNDGFGIGKGKIECAEMLDKPEHWRDDEADKI